MVHLIEHTLTLVVVTDDTMTLVCAGDDPPEPTDIVPQPTVDLYSQLSASLSSGVSAASYLHRTDSTDSCARSVCSKPRKPRWCYNQ